MRPILTTLLLTLVFYCYSQKIEVSNISVDNGKVSFIVQIEKSHTDRERYDLIIYHSANNFSQPIAYSPKNLEPGKAHRISFDGDEQVGAHQGPLSFRFDIEASKFPIRTQFDQQKFKIGKPALVEWYDYENVGPYDIELYKDGQLVETLASDVTQSFREVTLPSSLEKKEQYQIQIRASDRSMDSEKVTITAHPKMGLIVKILPAVAVGAAVPFLLPGDDGGGEPEGLANPPGNPDEQGN